MKIFKKIGEMQKWSQNNKKNGKRIVFVPTMGALHEGHLSLLREGRKRGDLLVLSIYVNPRQFGKNEDLVSYSRTIEDDTQKAKKEGVDALFLPEDTEIYPEGFETSVSIENITRNLCGASRPGHFTGVTTVVAKLFNIVQPDLGLFGEKDYQQLVTIKKMVLDLNMPIEIIGCPIVREKDGLAMSSRNKNLSPDERKAAALIFTSLNKAEEMVSLGETDCFTITQRVRSIIESSPLMKSDYVKVVNAEDMSDIAKFKRPALLAIAAFAGKTRLIDNRLFV